MEQRPQARPDNCSQHFLYIRQTFIHLANVLQQNCVQPSVTTTVPPSAHGQMRVLYGSALGPVPLSLFSQLLSPFDMLSFGCEGPFFDSLAIIANIFVTYVLVMTSDS